MTKPEGKDHHSLGYLVVALIMGGKISIDREKDLLMKVSARDYYDRNPLLQNIPENILTDNFKIVDYLVENRSKMTKPEGKKNNSLGYLVRALVMGGKVPPERERKLTVVSSAAEYALRKREILEEEILSSYNSLTNQQIDSENFLLNLRRGIDRTRLTQLRNQRKPISESYQRDVVKLAMHLYGNALIG